MGKKELTDQQLSAPAINFLDAVLPLEEKIQKYIFKGSLQNQMLRHIGLMALICELIFKDETGGHISLVNETETDTCFPLVLSARLRPRFIAPWSPK